MPIMMTKVVVVVLALAAACSARILPRVLLHDAVNEVGCRYIIPVSQRLRYIQYTLLTILACRAQYALTAQHRATISGRAAVAALTSGSYTRRAEGGATQPATA